ncbi:zinc ribbon domain-containing protein [Liquorilactobacillus sicerae]|uniref:zinc ribbon domain-containing protein n=1 Tax=Liquorilactobacillus sicerae TaxID=1416943 RepID=UPI0024801407|nr:zinc ribbon domain-containing protein [Liquorilactobacillus sicerae]
MKHCPNCNAEVDADAKFCTSCGTRLTPNSTGAVNQAPTATKSPATNTTSSQQNFNADQTQWQSQQAPQSRINSQVLQSALKDYWYWLVASWKKPFANQTANQYFGMISLFIEALLFSLGLGHIAQKGASTATDTANSIASVFSDSSYHASYSLGFGFYFSIILIIFIASLAMVGVSFLMFHAVSGNQNQETFLNYTNRIVHYSSLILVLDLVFCLVSFLSSVGSASILFSMLLLSLVSLIWSIALICGVVTFKSGGQFDRIYGAAVATLICSIIEIIAICLIASKLGDAMSSLLQSLF